MIGQDQKAALKSALEKRVKSVTSLDLGILHLGSGVWIENEETMEKDSDGRSHLWFGNHKQHQSSKEVFRKWLAKDGN